MSEWQTRKIKSLVKAMSSGGTPSKTEERYFINGEIKWARTQELNDKKLYNTDLKITKEALDSSSAKVFPVNTISMAMYGATVGRLAIFKDQIATNQACCNMLFDEKKANYLFMFYKFLHIRADLITRANGAAQQNLNVGIIGEYEVSLPELPIQKAIAKVLSSFDDKIENCNKIIANLNAQIEALFRNWFIDYAPFADNLSEEGIPISWRRYKFSDFITLKNEKSSDSDIPEFSVTNTGIFPRNTRFNKLLSTNRSNKVIRRNDLVFGMSREILNWGVMEEEIGGVSSAYTVFEVDQTKVNSNYLSRYMSSNILYFMDVIKPAAREGQGIEKKVLYNKDIVVPDDISWERFLDIYQPMNNEIANQKKQIEKLANTRDTLLPKLMSGEIEVPVGGIIMYRFLEDELEQATKEWFGNIGYETIAGAELSPGGELCDRQDYQSVLLQERLTGIIRKLNPTLNDSQVKDVYNAVARPNNANLMINNKNFHNYLINGVDYVIRLKNGETKTEKAKLVDFDNPINNDFLVVSQMTIIENGKERRPDLIVYLNGMPIVVIELKNTANDKVGIMKGFNQLQTYKKELTNLFVYNEFIITSDGINAKVGTMTSDFDRYMFWRTVDGNNENNILPQLQVMIMGMFDKNRLLELLQNYILFQDDGANIYKILAGYHQYNAVTKAVLKTLVASSENGNRKAGVIWHTQGSGKSLSMVFYTGLLVKKMNNPTVVLLTDRNDLDDQLFDTFAKSVAFLRQVPVQAESRKHLRDLLNVNAGGIVFTTIQKFSPDNTDTNTGALTKRSNVIVIADEAHRSQYGLTAKEIHGEISYGFAKYMRDALPNASFIGFTGTPIELSDKNTPALFGDYIDIYDISKSVKDNTTVPIYYENRLAKVNFNEAEKENIDIEYEDIVYEQEENYAEAQKRKWARLEAIVGTDSRVGLIARDFVKHFEERQKAMSGKALFVAMSRRIAVKFYDEVIKLRPFWHSDDIDKGAIKIVMTSDASDDKSIQKHSTTKEQRKMLAKRMKNPDDELKIVIVRDMWLTGFDAPCLTTIYVDKPMSGHNLIQAIARVNRVFRDKPGGLVVDYIGIADSLKDALANFTKSDRDVAGVDPQVALDILEEKYDQIKEILSDFDYSDYITGTPGQRVGCIVKCVDYIIGLGEEKKKNFLNYVVEISKAFALCATADKAENYNIDISFFKAVKSGIIKLLPVGTKKKTQEEVEFEIAQLVSKSVISDEVVDIMEAIGLNKPEISILSDEFLAEVQGLPQRNIAMELLKKLLANKIKLVMKRNLVQARKFSEMLEGTIALYQLRSIDTVQVIAELISYAKEMNKLPNRAEELGLTEDEVAFYDAISKNESAQEFMQDDVLKEIARELTKIIKNSTKLIDWEQREQVRAQMRVTIKRLLKKYKYPPDQQANAVKIIIEQAEEMCKTEIED